MTTSSCLPARQRSTSSAVPSVDPSSTTTICASNPIAHTASSTWTIVAASLYAGTRKEMRTASEPILSVGVPRFSLSEEIARPPEDVFAYLTDVSKLPEWQSSAISAESDGPVREGTRIREQRKFVGRDLRTELEV